MDVVLWDIVAGCGEFWYTTVTCSLLLNIPSARWHYKNPSVIDIVIPHPLADIFALFCKSSIPPPHDRQKTAILVFCVSSPTAKRSHSVPFGFLNVIWYPFAPSSSALSSFTLVGVTKSWSVVLVGDDVPLREEAGSSAREIVAGQSGQRRSLFQDIFGRSAFVDISNDVLSSGSQTLETYSRPWTGKEVARIFDCPAYRTPALESLYKPLMESFLRTRPKEDNEVTGGDEQPERDDIEDVDVKDVPIVVGSQERRVIGQDEMSFLVDLFRKHSMTCMFSKSSSPLSRLC
jgi:NET1-associated nuclear protein 1 (U3 small nucleolar RNA-associated protein 17)